MWEHLRFRGATVEARTEAGRFTVDYLDLNDPSLVDQREGTIHLIDLCLSAIRDAESIIKQIGMLYGRGEISLQIHDREIVVANTAIAKSQQSLRQLTPA